MPRNDGTLKAREFLFACEDQAMAALPGDFPQPERRVMWTILQLHYGDPDVHFELQPQVSRRQVELGLHFEGPVEANDAWAALVAARAGALMAALGPEWELEEWTPSWRRLHRVFAFDVLTFETVREVAAQMATMLYTLQPVVAEGLRDLGVARPARRSPGTRRHHRRRFARR